MKTKMASPATQEDEKTPRRPCGISDEDTTRIVGKGAIVPEKCSISMTDASIGEG
jgi:hypothetical protein